MADFIAKLGLDAKDFIAGMEAAAQKAGIIGKAMTDSAADSSKLADGLKKAGTEADGLAKSTAGIEDNLNKASSSGGALDGLTAKFKEGQSAAAAGGGMFGEVANKIGQLATPAGAATAAIGGITAALTASVAIGQEFQQNLAGVSAVTGLTGAGLDDIGNRARELAKRFGGEASTQLQAFQGVLSKFGAQLAETPDELGKVSENINILAKAGGLNAQEAMDTLANSMLQFGVNVSDGKEAAAESSRFINVLAASARVGAAEIPQVGQAVLVAGVAAKGAKVSFEETNAAIQVLAAGGKVGAEAGTALRNVLGKIAGEEVIPKPALDKLKSLGVDMSVVSDTSISLSDRLKELSKASGDATAFAQVFGTENAAAASILANGAATIEDWTAQITGTQDATTQAATNMNTFAEQISRAKAFIEDIAISLFNAFAPALTKVIGGVISFAQTFGSILGGVFERFKPVITAVVAAFVAYNGAMLLAAGYTKVQALASGILESAKIALGIATVTETGATEGATIAQLALNAAMSINPAFAVVAAVVALGAAYVMLSKSSEDAAKAELENAKAGMEVVQAQIKQNEEQTKGVESTKKLADRFQELASKTTLTKSEQKELSKITEQLDQKYPDLIDQTKSYADNLQGVKQISESTTNELKKLDSQNKELQKSFAESNKILIGATRNVAVAQVDTAIDEIYGLSNAFNSSAEQAENKLMRFGLGAKLFKAKTADEVDEIRAAFLEQLNGLQSVIGSEKYLTIATALEKGAQATKKALTDWASGNKAVVDEAAKTVESTATTAAAVAKPAKDTKASTAKSAKEIAEDQLKTERTNLETQSLIEQNKIKQLAIDQNRKLTATEQADILRLQIKLTDDIAEATRKIYATTGEGKDLKLGIKLDTKDQADVRNKVVDEIDKLTENKVKLEFQIINLNETVVKEKVDYISKTASIAKDEAQKKLNVDLFINDPTQAAKDATSKIDEIRKASNDAAALGDADTAAKIKRQADELQDKLNDINTKAAEKRKKLAEEEAKKAEELRRKNIEMTINAIEDENARDLAIKVYKLNEERNAVLKSTEGTEAERAAIAKRYQDQINALRTGISEQVEKDRLALAKDEQALKKSLDTKKISYEAYSSALTDIDKKRAAIDEQVKKNKAAADTAIAASAVAQIPTGKEFEFSYKGLKELGKDSYEAFQKLVAQGKSAEDAYKATLDILKNNVDASFDAIAKKASEALNFNDLIKTDKLLDNLQNLGQVIGSTFAKSKNDGKKDLDAYKDSIQAVNNTLSSVIGKQINTQEEAFRKAAEKGEATYMQIAEIAALSFGKAAVEGKNLLKESLKIVVESALKMIEINLVTILTAFGVTGPGGLLAGIAAVATLRGLAAAAFAKAGYKDGGYTGNGGTSDIAGVVHGQEFVHTAEVTRKNRALFEYLHKGGELSAWAINTAGQLQTPAIVAPQVNTYGIESRLDRLETAIVRGNKKFESMRAVQMTVEHDPTLTIKAQSRNLEIRSARS